jgi:tetratricopeptide (TPR) repeat protein
MRRSGVHDGTEAGSTFGTAGEMHHPLGGVPRPRAPTHDVPRVGRAEELRKLDGALVRAQAGQGTSWLLTGPPGIGKSRLLREVGRDAQRRGFRVYWAYGLRGTSLPLFTLLQLRPSGETSGSEPHASSRRRPRSGRAQRESVDASILAILLDLERAACERPVLAILDDLQYADMESLRGLRLLVRRFVDRPVVFLLAARTSRSAAHPSRGVESELDEVVQSGHLVTLELGPLSRTASVQLAASVLGKPAEIAGRLDGLRDLLDLADGSPFFVIELARAYLAHPSSEPSRAGSTGNVPPGEGEGGGVQRLPPIVRQSILERYGALSKDARRMLDLAAHLGFEFDGEALAIALRRPLPEVVRTLGPLAEERWPLRRVAGRRFRYTFDHGLLHSVVLEQGPVPSPIELKRVIGWWGRHHPDDPATEARLRRLAGDRRGTIRSIGRAIDGAIQASAYRLVPAYVADLPEAVGADRPAQEALVELYCATVRQLRERWEWEAQRIPLERLARLPLPEELRWTVRFWALDAETFHDRGHVRTELERLEREQGPALSRLPDEAHRLDAYLRAILVHTAGPDRRSVMSTLRRATRELDDGRHDFELFRVLVSGAMTLPNWGRYREATKWAARARAVLHRGSLDPARFGELLRMSEWVLELRAGDIAKGLRLSKENVRSARRLKNPSIEASALLNQGICEFEVRELEAADRSLSEAGALYENLGGRFGLLWSLILRGLSRAGLGDWSTAQELFERCRPILLEANAQYESWLVQVGGAFVTAAQGDPATGLAALPEGPAPGPDPKAFATEYRCIRSRILELNGDLRGARAELEAAYRGARRSGNPVERAEALVHRAGLERRAGSPGRERVYRDLLRRIRLPGGSSLLEGRQGIACGELPKILPERSPRGGAPPVRGRAGPPVAARILDLLARHPRGPPWQRADHSTTGWTELDMARGLGVPRGALARAVGRLLLAGSVERSVDRPPGMARRVYRYRSRAPQVGAPRAAG